MNTPRPQGWRCPKCDRVWGPLIPSCFHCNREVKKREEGPRLRITRVYEDGNHEVTAFRDSLGHALHEDD